MEKEFTSKVVACIDQTLRPTSPTELAFAHNQLEVEFPQDDRFLAVLLQISVNGSQDHSHKVHLQTKKVAAILLRKEIDAGWKKKVETRNPYSNDTKALVRDNIIEGMKRCGSLDVVRLLCSAASKILYRDYPHEWKDFDEKVLELLKSKELENHYIGLALLNSLGRTRQNFIGKDRLQIDKSATELFPLMIEVLNHIETQLGATGPLEIHHYLIVSCFFKNIYKWILVMFANQIDLPDCFYSPKYIEPLMRQVEGWIVKIKSTPLKGLANKPKLNVLKWVFRILNKFLFKYANSKRSSREEFPVYWSETYLLRNLKMSFDIISRFSEEELSENTMEGIIRSIYLILEYDQVRDLLCRVENSQQTRRYLEIILSCLRLREVELRYFEENTFDFLKNNNEIVQHEISSVRYFCILVLKKMIESDQAQHLCLDIFIEGLQKSQDTSTDPQKRLFMKEIIYSGLQICIAKFRISKFKDLIGDLINFHMIPELQADSHPFIQVRILSLLADILDNHTLISQELKIFEIVKSIIMGPNLVCTLAALICMEKLLNYDTILSRFSSSDSEKLVDLMLDVILKTENDSLVHSLSEVMLKFGFSLHMDSLRLIEKMYEIFIKLSDHIKSLQIDQNDSREIEEFNQAEITATQCISIIDNIVSERFNPDIVDQLCSLLNDVIARCYQNRDGDMVTASIRLMNSFVYTFNRALKALEIYFSIAIYSILPQVGSLAITGQVPQELVSTFASLPFSEDVMDENSRPIIIVLCNMVSVYWSQLLHNIDICGELWITSIINLCRFRLDQYIHLSYDQVPIADTLTLLSFIPISIQELPVKWIERIIDTTIGFSKKLDQSSLVQTGVELVISSCIFSNPKLTIQILEKINLLKDFLAIWLQNSHTLQSNLCLKVSILSKLRLLDFIDFSNLKIAITDRLLYELNYRLFHITASIDIEYTCKIPSVIDSSHHTSFIEEQDTQDEDLDSFRLTQDFHIRCKLDDIDEIKLCCSHLRGLSSKQGFPSRTIDAAHTILSKLKV